DGKIIIGGNFASYNGTSRDSIPRLNSDGSLDTSFDAGGANLGGGLLTIALQPDGKVIGGGSNTGGIARLNSDGSRDTSFDPGTGTDSTVFTTALQSDGKIIIGGKFLNYGLTSRSHIARLNSNGSVDTSFDPGT